MLIEPSALIAMGVLYLGSLFLIAHASERGWLPTQWVQHPWVYSLALGVYVTTWAFFGAIDFAQAWGYLYLTYFIGFSGAFLLAPVVMKPLLRLTQTYQLQSLADLMAYRFRSPAVGMFISVILTLGMMPILTQQIDTVSQVALAVSNLQQPVMTGAFFCAILAAFALLFGVRTRYGRKPHHDGLLVALAVESLIKWIAMVMIAGYAYLVLLGGPSGLTVHLAQKPDLLIALYEPLRSNYWHGLLLLFFLTAVVMPAIYHLAFVEHRQPADLKTASWLLPLYLMTFALGIPLILWAGQLLQPNQVATAHILAIVQHSGSLWLFVLLILGTLAASSGILIISTLALANMLVNNLATPLSRRLADDQWLARTNHLRRGMVIAIPFMALALHESLLSGIDSTDRSLLGFLLVVQVAPSVMALLFWPRATSAGVLTGLLVGTATWSVLLMVPLLTGQSLLISPLTPPLDWFGLSRWMDIALLCTGLNLAALIVVSLLRRQSPEEQERAANCAVDNVGSPHRWQLSVSSPHDFIMALTPALGPETAQREVQLALSDLGLSFSEHRPYALRRLRDRIEGNLSALLGPSVSQDILSHHVPQLRPLRAGRDDITLIESHLEAYRDQLSGLAAELDLLRRFHRQTLQDLPLGVCTLGHDLEVLSWNHVMARITEIDDVTAIGAQCQALPAPWGELMHGFLHEPQEQVRRRALSMGGTTRWINWHRAMIGDTGDTWVLVLEDVTPMVQLQSRVQHQDRLAGIGRLAAGVAHEIGNPMTGIASLAQNLQADFPHEPWVQESAQLILEQARRVTRIVQSLVSFAHVDTPPHSQLSAVPLREVMEQAVALLKLTPGFETFNMTVQASDDLAVWGDAQRLCQVFINLLTNARDASPSEGQVQLHAERHGALMLITVEDHGMGLPHHELRDRLFEPFVTTKPAGSGTGLGLALVHGIIEAHQGSIQLIDKRDYDQGQGVVVHIRLPAADPEGASD